MMRHRFDYVRYADEQFYCQLNHKLRVCLRQCLQVDVPNLLDNASDDNFRIGASFSRRSVARSIWTFIVSKMRSFSHLLELRDRRYSSVSQLIYVLVCRLLDRLVSPSYV